MRIIFNYFKLVLDFVFGFSAVVIDGVANAGAMSVFKLIPLMAIGGGVMAWLTDFFMPLVFMGVAIVPVVFGTIRGILYDDQPCYNFYREHWLGDVEDDYEELGYADDDSAFIMGVTGDNEPPLDTDTIPFKLGDSRGVNFNLANIPIPNPVKNNR